MEQENVPMISPQSIFSITVGHKSLYRSICMQSEHVFVPHAEMVASFSFCNHSQVNTEKRPCTDQQKWVVGKDTCDVKSLKN